MAMKALTRLGDLLDHATEKLIVRSSAANQAMVHLSPDDRLELHTVRHELRLAVTELQFYDMAAQLLVHTGNILSIVTHQLTPEAMGSDVCDARNPPIDAQLLKPNPVVRNEMGAGSIGLF